MAAQQQMMPRPVTIWRGVMEISETVSDSLFSFSLLLLFLLLPLLLPFSFTPSLIEVPILFLLLWRARSIPPTAAIDYVQLVSSPLQLEKGITQATVYTNPLFYYHMGRKFRGLNFRSIVLLQKFRGFKFSFHQPGHAGSSVTRSYLSS
jgi:hypothetical protein